MLIKRDALSRIASGEVTVAFRRWRRPTVRSGGSLRTGVGVLAIQNVEVVAPAQITEADARRAGFSCLQELMCELSSHTDGQVYRIELSLAGPDPRSALRESAVISDVERIAIQNRLDRFDRPHPWTRAALSALEDGCELHAVDLAERLGLQKPDMKSKMRKLKELGLTESRPSGYRISPRGRAFHAAGDIQNRKSKSTR